MEYKNDFLYNVCEDVAIRNKGNLVDTLVIFPNRRAIRFFEEKIRLSSLIKKPCFLPEICSIDDFVRKYVSDYLIGENLELLYLLYKVYVEVYYRNNPLKENETTMSFADFLSWGNLILSDFDEIDKSLVDAKSLYRNMQDYASLRVDPENYLTEEQIDLIKRMFLNSLDENNKIRKDFTRIWNCLYEIYVEYNALLDREHIAYSGKMYKIFAERLSSKIYDLSAFKDVNIVGFSVLSNVEKEIFSSLKEKYSAHFYYDYDEYYANNKDNEAGIFVRENLKNFPMDKSFYNYGFNNIITNKPKINIVETPYETLSLGFLNNWLKEAAKKSKELNRIAVVLGDESLVEVILKSLDEDLVDKVNITLGYSIAGTWLFGKIKRIVDNLVDKCKFTKEDIFLSLKELASTASSPQIDAIKKVNDILSAFVDILGKIDDKDLTNEIVKQSVYNTLKNLSVDIISDGIEGVQIMGMLETRTLDFDYVLVMSCSDDNIPKLSRAGTFIPYSFRKAFGMTDMERKTGVLGYYFYRLLNCCKEITYVYSTDCSSMVKEKSRFIRQLEVELPYKGETFINENGNNKKYLNYYRLSSTHYIRPNEREYFWNKSLLKFIDDGSYCLTPSAINNLIHCQQKFYLKNILFIREDIEDDDYLQIAFGNVFHGAINIFNEKLKETHDAKEEEVKSLIDESIKEYFSSSKNEEKDKRIREDEEKEKNKRVVGQRIYLDMIKKYIYDVYLLDKKEENIFIAGELELRHDIKLGEHIIHLKGRLDRLDLHRDANGDYVLRIIDYKTGNDRDKKISSFDDIFYNKSDDKPRNNGMDNVFEIIMYAYLVYHNKAVIEKILREKGYKADCSNVYPELMYLSNINDRQIVIKPDRKSIPINFCYNEQSNKLFEAKLQEILSNILNMKEGEKIKANLSENICEWCEYKLLCRTSIGRGEQTRTADPLHPMQVR